MATANWTATPVQCTVSSRGVEPPNNVNVATNSNLGHSYPSGGYRNVQPESDSGTGMSQSGDSKGSKQPRSHPAPDLTVTKYERLADLQEIGKGGFGIVYRARHLEWGQIALKKLLVQFINKRDRVASELQQEVSMHIRLRHPNVITLIAMIFEPGHYGVILEYACYGSLRHFVDEYKPVPWPWKMSQLYDVALGMNYLHTQQRPIVHGDLKLVNVLVAEGYKAKISDFGLAKWKQYSMEKSHRSVVPGTVTHIPPENWQDINCRRTEKFDVYSFGILVWELVTEGRPFDAELRQPTRDLQTATIKNAVTRGSRPDRSQIPPEVPPIFMSLAERCWNGVPVERPKFGEVKKELETTLAEHKLKVKEAKAQLLRKEHEKSQLRQQQSVLSTLPTSVKTGTGAMEVEKSHTRQQNVIGTLPTTVKTGGTPMEVDDPGSHHVQIQMPDKSQYSSGYGSYEPMSTDSADSRQPMLRK